MKFPLCASHWRYKDGINLCQKLSSISCLNTATVLLQGCHGGEDTWVSSQKNSHNPSRGLEFLQTSPANRVQQWPKYFQWWLACHLPVSVFKKNKVLFPCNCICSGPVPAVPGSGNFPTQSSLLSNFGQLERLPEMPFLQIKQHQLPTTPRHFRTRLWHNACPSPPSMPFSLPVRVSPRADHAHPKDIYLALWGVVLTPL